MATESEILKRIYDETEAKMKPAARRFMPLSLRSTAQWTGSRKLSTSASSRRFRPSYFFMAITILLFGGATALLSIEMIFKPQDKLGLMIFLLVLFVGILLFAVYQFFLNKNLNFTITIDATGIRVAGDMYGWKEIGATAILTKGAGKNTSRYFVVALADGSYYKVYPIRLFMSASIGGFAVELSRWVEYFRNKGRPATPFV